MEDKTKVESTCETKGCSRCVCRQSSLSPLMKDLLMPAAIVVAGVFIGAGLYFSGSPAGAPAGGAAANKANPLVTLAVAAGVKEKAFTTCLDSQETLSLVQEDADNASATGGQGTPWSIVIGPNGKKYPMSGALPQASIEQLIELAKSGGEPESTEGIEALENMAPVTEADHIKGNIGAKVMIVEYSDYDCPFCARFHATMNAVVAKYGPDEVAWVYRHLPLESLHPNAVKNAVAAECVAKLGGNEAFWKFSDGYLKK